MPWSSNFDFWNWIDSGLCRSVTRLDGARGKKNKFGPPCSKMKSFGSKCAIEGSTCGLFGVPRSGSAPGNCTPSLRPKAKKQFSFKILFYYDIDTAGNNSVHSRYLFVMIKHLLWRSITIMWSQSLHQCFPINFPARKKSVLSSNQSPTCLSVSTFIC